MAEDPTPIAPTSPAGVAELGSDAWLAAQSTGARSYQGERYTVEVVVSGDRSGGGVTYHVVLEDGAPPQFRSGPAVGEASATLEMTRTDAEAQQRLGRHPVIGYMRGTTKTKGATRPIYELFRLLA